MSRYPKPFDDKDYDGYTADDLEQEEKLKRRRRSEDKRSSKEDKTPRKTKRHKYRDKA